MLTLVRGLGHAARQARRIQAALIERLQLGLTLSRVWSLLRRDADDRAARAMISPPTRMIGLFDALREAETDMNKRHLRELGFDLPPWRPTFRISDELLRTASTLCDVEVDSPREKQLRIELETVVPCAEDAHWTKGSHLFLRVTIDSKILVLEVLHGSIVAVSA